MGCGPGPGPPGLPMAPLGHLRGTQLSMSKYSLFLYHTCSPSLPIMETGTVIPRSLCPNLGVPSDSLVHPTSNLLASPIGFTFKMQLEPTSPPCFHSSHLTQIPQSFRLVPLLLCLP